MQFSAIIVVQSKYEGFFKYKFFLSISNVLCVIRSYLAEIIIE